MMKYIGAFHGGYDHEQKPDGVSAVFLVRSFPMAIMIPEDHSKGEKKFPL